MAQPANAITFSNNVHGKSKRQLLDILYSELATERARYESMYSDLGTYVLPNRYRRYVSDHESGSKRDAIKIIDPSATRAVRTAAAGMVSGGTSPARPWFRLTTPDPELAKFGRVKQWLHEVTKEMLAAFLKSNIYQILPLNYADTFVFGTAAMLLESHPRNVLHAFSYPCGSYFLAKDRYGKINTFVRDFQMSVWQIINTFGQKNASGSIDWSNISPTVKYLWDNSQYQQRVDVRHVIEPNDNADKNKLEPKHKPWSSFYYETGNSSKTGSYQSYSNNDVFLRESGYDHFPVLCPRWQTVGEDVYGTDSPAEIALGDIKQLQTMQIRKAQVVELKARPPMVADPVLKASSPGIIPGHITWVAEPDGNKRFRSALEVDLDISHLTLDIQDIRQSIRSTMFEDLFLMLAMSDRKQITAREVAERSDEKLMMLGPVIHQLDQDQNDPLIDMTFQYLLAQGKLPPPPDEIQGTDLRVEYVSILHQAQKALGLTGLERFTGYLTALSATFPNARYKLVELAAAEEYAEMAGVSPKVVRSDDDAEEMIASEQERMAEQRAMEQAQAGATMAKDLANAPLDNGSALGQMVQQAEAGQVVPSGV